MNGIKTTLTGSLTSLLTPAMGLCVSLTVFAGMDAVAECAPQPDATWRIRFREPAKWNRKGWQTRSLSFGNG